MDSQVQVFSVKISTIAHATEDPKKIVQTIRNLSLGEPSIDAIANRAKGHHGNEIVTLVFVIRNPKIAQSLVQSLWNSFSPMDRVEVYSSLALRIDSTGTFFLRIDKQEAFKGRVSLQDADPIKIEIGFRSKPSKRNELVDDIRRTLEGLQAQPGKLA